MKIKTFLILFIINVVSIRIIYAQETLENDKNTFIKAASTVQLQLVESLTELSALREDIVSKKIPLNRKLNKLENELINVRGDYQKTSRLLDSRTLDLSNLTNEIRLRSEESTYISNLLNEYIRNFESRLHIAEIQRYEKVLNNSKLASENSNLTEHEIFLEQIQLVTASLNRIDGALGGARFQGNAIDDTGLVKRGTFVLVGPSAFFCSDDEQVIGTVEQRLGSLEPTIIRFQNPSDVTATNQVIKNSQGYIPLDPTLGNAHKIESTNESLWEHVQKGGPVMIPIFMLAGAALIVSLYKWVFLTYQRKPSQKKLNILLNAISKHDKNCAKTVVANIEGPTGKMLVKGVEHINEPCELIEEVMYETILSTRLKLQSFLHFVAISASSAPLLGLLGTVTGIINTFKLITIFGSGDVKTLSGGISEALITTKFGLIVAIPSLLIYAFLSRKARGIISQMEKAAISFVNQVNITSNKRTITVKETEKGEFAEQEEKLINYKSTDKNDNNLVISNQ